MMKTEIQVKGLNEAITKLKSLPQDVVYAKGSPIKLALRKAAVLIREEEKSRLKSLMNVKGHPRRPTELLLKNIIASRGRMPQDTKGEKYVVRVKRRIYTDHTGEEPVNTLKTAQLFEYGSSHQPQRPFIRPSFQSKAQEAITVFRDELLKRIDKLVVKYGNTTGE